jgi:hypothetical protein
MPRYWNGFKVWRGGSFMNDRYRVRMQVTPPDTDEGASHYKIVEVLDFAPAEQQMALPLKRGKKAAKPKPKPKQKR